VPESLARLAAGSVNASHCQKTLVFSVPLWWCFITARLGPRAEGQCLAVCKYPVGQSKAASGCGLKACAVPLWILNLRRIHKPPGENAYSAVFRAAGKMEPFPWRIGVTPDFFIKRLAIFVQHVYAVKMRRFRDMTSRKTGKARLVGKGY
jgi:hypothetical protein